MAKQKQHDLGADDKEHGWIVNSYVFPESGTDGYEYDEPYAVLYCACGSRKTEILSESLIDEVRGFNQLPPEEILSADDNEGGE